MTARERIQRDWDRWPLLTSMQRTQLAAALMTALEESEKTLREIADTNREWGDVDPYDGLSDNSVREFAANALGLPTDYESMVRR